MDVLSIVFITLVSISFVYFLIKLYKLTQESKAEQERKSREFDEWREDVLAELIDISTFLEINLRERNNESLSSFNAEDFKDE